MYIKALSGFYAIMDIMVDIAKAKDIMTKEVLFFDPEESLETVAQVFERYDYDGLPVANQQRKLLGIITGYDMIMQSLGMHLPTVVNILNKIKVNQADRKDLDEHFQKLKEIKAKQIMNTLPLTVDPEAGLEEVAKLFAEHHRVNPICVADASGTLLGIISRYDVIRFFNEKYFQQMAGTATKITDPFADIKTKSQREVESAVSDISNEFLLVTKSRPAIWKIFAIAAFIAGLVAATALIIRLVQKEDSFNQDFRARVISIDNDRRALRV